MDNVSILAADNPIGTFGTLDLAQTLLTTGGIIAAVVGGSAVLAIGVWQLGLGIDLGLKRFTKISKKA